MIGRGVERDGVVELDEENLFEGGDAVGVEGEELVIPHEADVRPDEGEGCGEQEEEGEEGVGTRGCFGSRIRGWGHAGLSSRLVSRFVSGKRTKGWRSGGA